MLLLLVLAASSLLADRGTSLPVEPRAEPTAGWVPDPNGRGTMGLILSCFLTLGLCVWSAMHLNIPPKHESQTGYMLRNLKWAVLGVLIPELVVLSAWRQWLSARKMGIELEGVFRRQQADGQAPRRHKWTVEHSYFAGMGGFAFDAAYLPVGKDCFLLQPDRLTLTAAGVLLLAECGHLPDIDREIIRDKSKADGIAKALVCIQVTWMIGQVVGRMTAHIPITLLEVNTLGHVFCAFVIYALWWSKPKQVLTPIILDGSWTKRLAAYMYMSSRISGKKLEGILVLSQWIQPELHGFTWHPAKDVSLSADQDAAVSKSEVCSAAPSGDKGEVFSAASNGNKSEVCSASSNGDKSEVISAVSSGEKKAAECSVRACQDFGALRQVPSTSSSKSVRTVIRTAVKEPTTVEDDCVCQNRYAACAEAISLYSCILAQFEYDASRECFAPRLNHLVTDVATNWPSDFYLPGISGELMGMALWFSSSLYGGIHLAAWSDYFPSQAERFMWRFSATFVASSGAFWFLLCIIALRWPFASSYWDRFIQLRAWKIEYAVLGLGATLCGLTYILARVFLVVGAVVSLRQLPFAAYQTPDWTTVFPHF